ncbi:MAG: hypothetical protein QGG48_13100, partial [Desulfatiglandales bacterium]|nr:hypothetical protein [Desulfatiglandales bacterium]
MRCPIVLLLMLYGSLPLFAQSTTLDEARFAGAFLTHYDFFSALHPRLEGSHQEKQAVAYILKKLDELDSGYSHVDFNDLNRGHSFSSSIYVAIPGILPDELLIVAPLNSREKSLYGRDGAVNLSLALALVEAFVDRAPPISLNVLFLGSEFGTEELYPMGTGKFLDDYFPEFNTAVIYLDFEGPPARVIIRSGDSNFVAPYWLTDQCKKNMDREGIYSLVRGNENQFYRLGTAANPAPLYPYLADEYPAISFHSSQSLMDRSELPTWAASFSRFFDGFIEANIEGFPEEWDRHYLFFQARNFSLLINERSYILIFICILGFMVVYPLVMPKRFKSYALSIFQNLWALP